MSEAQESAPNVAQRMTAVYRAAFNVEKNGFNRSQDYAYATVDDVKAAANRALRDSGFYVSHCRLELVEQTPFTKNADGSKTPGRAVVKILLVVSDACGSRLTLEGVGEGLDNGDKALCKAQAGAIKYALLNGLLIATGDRDDAEADETTDAAAKAPAKVKAADEPKADVPATDKAGALFDEIRARGTLDDLKQLQKPIHALKGKIPAAKLEELVAAYKARAAELEQQK